MKKILMTLSLALAAVVAIPVAANAQTDKDNCKTVCTDTCTIKNGQCTANKGYCKDKKAGKHGKKDKGNFRKDGRKGDFAREAKGDKMRRGESSVLFKGINLSEQQKQEFKALREKRVAAHKAERAEMKKATAEARKAKAEAYDKEVEKILTPDQYKQYLANKQAADQVKRGQRK